MTGNHDNARNCMHSSREVLHCVCGRGGRHEFLQRPVCARALDGEKLIEELLS